MCLSFYRTIHSDLCSLCCCFLVKVAFLELNSFCLYTLFKSLQIRASAKFPKCEKANVFPHYLCMQTAGFWSLPSPPIRLRRFLQAETQGTILLWSLCLLFTHLFFYHETGFLTSKYFFCWQGICFFFFLFICRVFLLFICH